MKNKKKNYLTKKKMAGKQQTPDKKKKYLKYQKTI